MRISTRIRLRWTRLRIIAGVAVAALGVHLTTDPTIVDVGIITVAAFLLTVRLEERDENAGGETEI